MVKMVETLLVMEATEETIVPNAVSVISYDDVLLAKYCRPKLTTMRYPIEAMAMCAAELALRYTAGGQPELGTTFKYTPTVVKRESVVKLREKN